MVLASLFWVTLDCGVFQTLGWFLEYRICPLSGILSGHKTPERLCKLQNVNRARILKVVCSKWVKQLYFFRCYLTDRSDNMLWSHSTAAFNAARPTKKQWPLLWGPRLLCCELQPNSARNRLVFSEFHTFDCVCCRLTSTRFHTEITKETVFLISLSEFVHHWTRCFVCGASAGVSLASR